MLLELVPGGELFSLLRQQSYFQVRVGVKVRVRVRVRILILILILTLTLTVLAGARGSLLRGHRRGGLRVPARPAGARKP